MKALLPTVLIAFAAAQVGIAQEVADGAATDWRESARYAKAAEGADPESVMHLIASGAKPSNATWGCASCHGDRGEGAQNIPRLAGVSAGYLIKQLHDYKNGTRINDNMQYVVSTLTDEEMAALGVYYAGLDTGPSAEPSLGGDLDRGRELALQGDWAVDLPSCFACHGPLGWGVEDTFPAIAGQHPSYTHTQLAAWKSGHRKNSPLGLMHSVAAALSAEDMQAISDFLASLPPPQSRNPGP